MSEPLRWRPLDESAWREALEAGPAAAELEAPGLVDWTIEVVGVLLDWVFGALGRALPSGFPLELVVLWSSGAVVAVALALSAVFVYRMLRRRPSRPTVSEIEPAAGTGVPELGAAEWRGRLGERLAAGDLPGALEAAWWWLARRYGPPGLDESWTTSDLVREEAAARWVGTLRTIDSWRFGVRGARREEIEHLVEAVERGEAA